MLKAVYKMALCESQFGTEQIIVLQSDRAELLLKVFFCSKKCNPPRKPTTHFVAKYAV